MNSFLLKRKFSSSLLKEIKLTKIEMKEINHLLKEPYVKKGWHRVVGSWLLMSAGITFGMIILGGYVRLNKAGLSMVTWDLSRIYPPKTPEEWYLKFEEYKAHPQYKNDFEDLSMDGFKKIYLLEHYHRQLGKVLGWFFLIPAAVFSYTGIFRSKMKKYALGMSLLIVTQGIIGIWMVRSGLKENLGDNYKKKNVVVSHYRLAVHFTFGVLTYCLLLKFGLFLLSKPMVLKTGFEFLLSNNIIRRSLMLSLHLVFFTAIYGSLMAGTDAGKISNTFPKMGDLWVPSYYHYSDGVIKSNFENLFVIHFNHRFLATATVGIIFTQFFRVLGLGYVYKGAARGFALVATLGLVQFLIGVYSVLSSVPPKLAHLHQFTGIVTITAFIIGLNLSRRVTPSEIKIFLKMLAKKDSKAVEKHLFHFKNLHPQAYERYVKDNYDSVKKELGL